MRPALVFGLLLAWAGPAAADPTFSAWAYDARVRLDHPTPPPLGGLPSGVYDQNFTWAAPAHGPVSGAVVSGGGGPAFTGGDTGLPAGTYLAYLGQVIAYTTADPMHAPAFRAAGRDHLTYTFTLDDQRGRQTAVTFSGTLDASFDGGRAIGSSFAFDGPATRSVTVGGIDYDIVFGYGTAPGRDGINGYVFQAGPDERGYAGDFYALVTPSSNLPEPGTLALAGIGFGLVVGFRRRSAAR